MRSKRRTAALCWLLVTLCWLLVTLFTASAAADEPEPATVSELEPTSASEPTSKSFTWRWRRHHWADYVATGVFTTTAILAEVVPERDDPRWFGPIGFDTEFRNAFVLGNFDDRRIAARVSDATLAALVIYRVLDSALGTWAGHGAGDVAWQMAAIDLQALAFTTSITNATKRAAERERPSGTACREEPGYDQRCRDQGSDGSFFSGHTSLAFTAASLTCVQHGFVPTYGGAGDTLACVAASLAAASVGFERILADRHYVSDVLVGSAVGVFSGAVLPFVSFYSRPTDTALDPRDPIAVWSIAPMASPNGGMVSMRGLF